MALTRKFLSAMGIEAEKVDEIIAAHSETVNALKEERDEAKKEAEVNKANADKLAEVQQELDKLKKEDNPFEEQYKAIKAEKEKIQAEFDAYKKDIEDKNVKATKTNVYAELLKEAGINEKRIQAVLKLSDDEINKLELDKDNKLADEAKTKLVEAIKTDWAEYISQTGTVGANIPNPPANNGSAGGGKASRAAEIAARYHANLYGETKKED